MHVRRMVDRTGSGPIYDVIYNRIFGLYEIISLQLMVFELPLARLASRHSHHLAASSCLLLGI